MSFRRFISFWIVLSFFFTSLGPLPKAQADLFPGLPQPGTMVNLSPVFEPALIKGLTVHKDNPFLFDFILDTGKSGLAGDALKKEGDRLVKYFFACLTIPDKDLWVNLSPYEKDRMVPSSLGQTALGRDLLAQDYILKQLTASLIYPEKNLGREFWDRVYAKARQMYGTTQIPVNTFNKVWILADKATVYEHNQTAFVLDGHLKVMLEEDYLALQKHVTLSKKTNNLASNIVRQIVLPEIEKEVNQGRNFASLRQIFNSMILASWYKKNLKEALLNQLYADKSTVKGVNLADPSVKEKIYQQYIQAYKKGVFNYIKEDNSNGESIPRKYFSGGFSKDPEMLRVVNDKTPGTAAMLTKTLLKLSAILFSLTVLVGCETDYPNQINPNPVNNYGIPNPNVNTNEPTPYLYPYEQHPVAPNVNKYYNPPIPYNPRLPTQPYIPRKFNPAMSNAELVKKLYILENKILEKAGNDLNVEQDLLHIAVEFIANNGSQDLSIGVAVDHSLWRLFQNEKVRKQAMTLLGRMPSTFTLPGMVWITVLGRFINKDPEVEKLIKFINEGVSILPIAQNELVAQRAEMALQKAEDGEIPENIPTQEDDLKSLKTMGVIVVGYTPPPTARNTPAMLSEWLNQLGPEKNEVVKKIVDDASRPGRLKDNFGVFRKLSDRDNPFVASGLIPSSVVRIQYIVPDLHGLDIQNYQVIANLADLAYQDILVKPEVSMGINYDFDKGGFVIHLSSVESEYNIPVGDNRKIAQEIFRQASERLSGNINSVHDFIKSAGETVMGIRLLPEGFVKNQDFETRDAFQQGEHKILVYRHENGTYTIGFWFINHDPLHAKYRKGVRINREAGLSIEEIIVPEHLVQKIFDGLKQKMPFPSFDVRTTPPGFFLNLVQNEALAQSATPAMLSAWLNQLEPKQADVVKQIVFETGRILIDARLKDYFFFYRRLSDRGSMEEANGLIREISLIIKSKISDLQGLNINDPQIFSKIADLVYQETTESSQLRLSIDYNFDENKFVIQLSSKKSPERYDISVGNDRKKAQEIFSQSNGQLGQNNIQDLRDSIFRATQAMTAQQIKATQQLEEISNTEYYRGKIDLDEGRKLIVQEKFLAGQDLLIVDNKDEPVGLIDRNVAEALGLITRATNVVVVTPDGKILTQRRASQNRLFNKYLSIFGGRLGLEGDSEKAVRKGLQNALHLNKPLEGNLEAVSDEFYKGTISADDFSSLNINPVKALEDAGYIEKSATVPELSLAALKSIKNKKYDPAYKGDDGIWMEAYPNQPEEVRKKPNIELKAEDVRKDMTPDDFEKFWSLYQQANNTEITDKFLTLPKPEDLKLEGYDQTQCRQIYDIIQKQSKQYRRLYIYTIDPKEYDHQRKLMDQLEENRLKKTPEEFSAWLNSKEAHEQGFGGIWSYYEVAFGDLQYAPTGNDTSNEGKKYYGGRLHYVELENNYAKGKDIVYFSPDLLERIIRNRRLMNNIKSKMDVFAYANAIDIEAASHRAGSRIANKKNMVTKLKELIDSSKSEDSIVLEDNIKVSKSPNYTGRLRVDMDLRTGRHVVFYVGIKANMLAYIYDDEGNFPGGRRPGEYSLFALTGKSLLAKVEALIKQQTDAEIVTPVRFPNLEDAKNSKDPMDVVFDSKVRDIFRVLVNRSRQKDLSKRGKTALGARPGSDFLDPENQPPDEVGIRFNDEWSMFPNPNPYYKNHVVLVMNGHKDKYRRQNIDEPGQLGTGLEFLWDLAKTEDRRDFNLVFNSSGAAASSPHFHFHIFELPLPIVKEPITFVEKGDIKLGMVKNYPANVMVVEGKNRQSVIAETFAIIQRMQNRKDPVPYNLVAKVLEDGSIRIYIFPRDQENPAKADKNLINSNFGVCEMSGVIIVKDRDPETGVGQFEAIDTKALTPVTLENIKASLNMATFKGQAIVLRDFLHISDEQVRDYFGIEPTTAPLPKTGTETPGKTENTDEANTKWFIERNPSVSRELKKYEYITKAYPDNAYRLWNQVLVAAREDFSDYMRAITGGSFSQEDIVKYWPVLVKYSSDAKLLSKVLPKIPSLVQTFQESIVSADDFDGKILRIISAINSTSASGAKFVMENPTPFQTALINMVLGILGINGSSGQKPGSSTPAMMDKLLGVVGDNLSGIESGELKRALNAAYGYEWEIVPYTLDTLPRTVGDNETVIRFTSGLKTTIADVRGTLAGTKKIIAITSPKPLDPKVFVVMDGAMTSQLSQANAALAEAPVAKKRILIINTDRNELKTWGRLLSPPEPGSAGYLISMTDDPQMALRYYQAAPHLFQMVLGDATKSTGKILSRIRGMDKELPIIIRARNSQADLIQEVRTQIGTPAMKAEEKGARPGKTPSYETGNENEGIPAGEGPVKHDYGVAASSIHEMPAGEGPFEHNPGTISTANEAMKPLSHETTEHHVPGGINLNSSNMSMTVTKDANGGVKVNFDPAIIARFRQYGIKSAVPVIIGVHMMPVTDIRPLLGFSNSQPQQ